MKFALEAITNKTKELTAVAETLPVNTKLLQLQLQGAVMAAVNEGPLEIARAFFGG